MNSVVAHDEDHIVSVPPTRVGVEGLKLSILTALLFGMLVTTSLHLTGISGCGGGTTRAAAGATETGSGGIVDETGVTLTSVDTNDPVNLNLSGLTANTQYNISVTNPSGVSLSPAGGFVVTTDEDGNLPSSTVVQDLSTTTETATLLAAGTVVPRMKAQTGSYTIAVTNAAAETVFTGSFTVADNSKVFCSDLNGTARASFAPADTVYATIQKGSGGRLADGTYTCYTRSDLGAQLADQDPLQGASVTVTVSGGTGTAALGSFSTLGPYDVVCDVDGDGRYDRGPDLIARAARFRPCFTIQDANSGGDIIGQVCSDRNGNYRDIFDPNATDAAIRDVFAWISPQELSLVTHAIGVRKYVVAHQDSWTNGATLTDVDANEVDAVQAFCTNEAPWLVWPRQNLVTGCYDCIIDVDANGVYNKGTDFVDNIDNTGDNTVGGMCVSNTACDIITISSHTSGDSVSATAVTLAGTLSESVSSGKVVVTVGSSSSTVTIGVAGNSFSANIPLFNGENLITLSVTKTDGTVCSKTITITSTAKTSSDEAFRAQLTWDGDTDMDLHLVEPGGEYANVGFGNEESASDCNFSNCQVGLDGVEGTGHEEEGLYSITWGARLDVDCASCGNGIENIWLQSVSVAGDYKVYVNAFGGSETAVSVSIFINGANVGTVACGAMASGTATNSCFVGTWNSTTGLFSADGTKGADF